MATNTLYADLNELTCVLSGSGCDFTPITADDCNEVADAVAAAVEAAQLKQRAGSVAERHAAYIDDVTATAASAAAAATAAAAAAGSIVLGVYVVNEYTLNEELIRDVKMLNIRLYTHRLTLTAEKQNEHDITVAIKMDQGKRDGRDLKSRFELLDPSIDGVGDNINELCNFYIGYNANITFKECRWTNTIGRWQKAIEQYRVNTIRAFQHQIVTIGAFEHKIVLSSDLQSPADYVMIYQVLGIDPSGHPELYELPIPVSCKSSVKFSRAALTIKNLGVSSCLAYAAKANAVSIFGSSFGEGDLADYVVKEVGALIRVDNKGKAITDAKAKSELIDPSVEHRKEDMTAIGDYLMKPTNRRSMVPPPFANGLFDDPRLHYNNFVTKFRIQKQLPQGIDCIKNAWRQAVKEDRKLESSKMIMFSQVRLQVIKNIAKCWGVALLEEREHYSVNVSVTIMKQFLRSMLDIRSMEYLKIYANGPENAHYSCINENTLSDYIDPIATDKIKCYFILHTDPSTGLSGPTFTIYVDGANKGLMFRIKCASTLGSSLKIDVKDITAQASIKQLGKGPPGRTKQSRGQKSRARAVAADVAADAKSRRLDIKKTVSKDQKKKKLDEKRKRKMEGGEFDEIRYQDTIGQLEDELRSIIDSMHSSHEVCPIAEVSHKILVDEPADQPADELEDEDYNEELDKITKYWFTGNDALVVRPGVKTPLKYKDVKKILYTINIEEFKANWETYFKYVHPWTSPGVPSSVSSSASPTFTTTTAMNADVDAGGSHDDMDNVMTSAIGADDDNGYMEDPEEETEDADVDMAPNLGGGKKTRKYKKVRKSRKKPLSHRRKTHRRKTHRRKTKKRKTTRRKKKN